MTFSPPKPWNLFGINVQGDLAGITYYKNQRGKLVWFPKSPPLNPPSVKQQEMRNLFRLWAGLWRSLTPQQRADYEIATKRAGLRINGYNLWIYINRTLDYGTLATIERNSGTTLIRPT